MKYSATLALLALCVHLAGCGRLQEVTMTAADKVNAAHPMSSEVRSAQDRLMLLLADNKTAVDAEKRASDSRLTLRALACTKTAAIGRLDSVDQVKRLGLSSQCFQEQDAELKKYFGIRLVGTLLSMPPLRPKKDGQAVALLPKGKLSSIVTGAVARDAGVGVLMDGYSSTAVVEVPGGAPISQLPRVGSLAHMSLHVSPNGRVVVFNPEGGGPIFMEAETGNRVWTVESSGAVRLLAWLPQVDALALSGMDGKVVLVDGTTGTTRPHPMAPANSTFAAAIPGATSRVLMGTDRELVLVDHSRTPDGLQASAVRQFGLEGISITSGQPVSMHDGHLVVFAAGRDLGWLDIDSGRSGVWRSSPLFGNIFAKLDENRIMFDATDVRGMSLTPWSFDTTSAMVAPIDLGEVNGLIIGIGDRIGYFKRGNEAWFGDQVKVGRPQSLDRVVADFELQKQLVNLERQTGQTTDDAAHASSGAAPPTPPAPPTPAMSGLPADAIVHIVGVYEGKAQDGPSTPRRGRNVRVIVRPTTRPIVLVLTSYESVHWVVSNTGARIAAVLISGYEPSTASGIGNTQTLRIGGAYAYSAGSREYAQLRQVVTQYTGNREVRSFQGGYSGVEFIVGGN